MTRRPNGRDGFTLIEALVAFAILALIMVTVQRVVSSAIAGITRADDRVSAETVARTLLSSPLTPADIASGRTDGTLNGLSWTRSLSPLGAVAAVGADGGGWTAMRMTVAVSAPQGRGVTSVETVRLVPTGPLS